MRPPVACDILIVGGGAVGMSLLLALRASGHDAYLAEARHTPPLKDARALAMSAASERILHGLGAWPTHVTPIHTVYVSQEGSFGRIKLTREEMQLPALGYVCAMRELAPLLWQKTAAHGLLPGWRVQALHSTRAYVAVELTQTGSATTHLLTARLVVLADGGASLPALTGAHTHSKEYAQVAILAKVHASHAQPNTAYERFAHGGPIAVLPDDEGYSVVWTQTGSIAETLVECPEAEFCHALEQRLGERLGQVQLVSERRLYPLRLVMAPRVPLPRVITVGNAAQTLHPIAGQGLNLGLRDTQVLVNVLQGANDPGDTHGLSRYRERRLSDQLQTIGFTDALVEGFRLPGAFVRHARSLALTGVDIAPGPRRHLLRQLVFGVRT